MSDSYTPRLKRDYHENLRGEMTKEFGYSDKQIGHLLEGAHADAREGDQLDCAHGERACQKGHVERFVEEQARHQRPKAT